MSPRILILRAPGTNCDLETAHAFHLAGGQTELVHIQRLVETPAAVADFQIICFPGGFSYGDNIAAGRILSSRIRHYLSDALQAFKDAGKLILGICNGFQVLIQTDLLATRGDDTEPPATLTDNDSGRFEDRWVHLKVDGDRCVFLRGMSHLTLPIAHAEGKFVSASSAALERLCQNGQLALRYCRDHSAQEECSDSRSGGAASMLPFPFNPNGSQEDVAGVCDESGRVFGLMPHP
ncbi:MAG: phosphoribosylformylglycinamidine synthase subunit PurQ [Planctomycetales bacterium]|nr:phosphoribosylformylglycinamidine synthase subunit PurQ [Planctomycetales bacterium]